MRKRQGITDDDVVRWIKNGYGQGQGNGYRPYFHVRDVPSEGEGHELPLRLFPGRREPHQYLSYLEASIGCVIEWLNAIEIREQYAALSETWDRSETIQIADSLGVRHPVHPGTTTQCVITTDIVAILPQGIIDAVYVKPSALLDPKTQRGRRNLQKRMIEEVYWSRRERATFRTADEFTYSDVYRRNAFDLRARLFQKEYLHLIPRAPEIVLAIVKRWGRTKTQYAIVSSVANDVGLSPLEVTNLLYRSIWDRTLVVDIESARLHPNNPVLVQ
ncbi:TnsA endonuclease N-terminal domain-containing protein [Nevskia ramosa]|uniref:TnsA endonuclease N-terminal domain-containing protein n=1 Tax=Nevskia ramosa TaxID=64002 RepID=UPI0023570CBE|nr:TnsA endonuclease N-terminal domain-containing protein [Nevskia ramosa]